MCKVAKATLVVNVVIKGQTVVSLIVIQNMDTNRWERLEKHIKALFHRP